MFIRAPQKPASEYSGTDLFSVDAAGINSGSGPGFEASHRVDIAFEIPTTGSGFGRYLASRLTGQGYMFTTNTDAEATGTSLHWDFDTGWLVPFATASNYSSFMFKRTPGFVDSITYEGTGSATTKSHMLNAVPEMIWCKNRETSNDGWAVYHKNADASSPEDKYLHLNQDSAVADSNTYWNDTVPTASVFSVGTSADVNETSEQYIAYLFSSTPGVSKVGSYTGTGSAGINVDCGFSAGARLVLIKRSDSSGDWYFFYSIVAGNDSYLLLNTATAAVTSTDYIDPLNAGFTVQATSSETGLNASGGNYIFLAIA